MKIKSLFEQTTPKNKAGIIPYFVNEDGQIEMYFMVPSDPTFGGNEPQIAKGKLDGNEDSLTAAFREGEEELGLKQSNVIGSPFLVISTTLSGLQNTYSFDVYACQVKSKEDFDQPHYETGQTFWLTPEQFETKGRRSQRKIVAKAANTINSRRSSPQ